MTEVANAEAAFAALETQDWTLVVCDVLLGGTDGYAVLRRFTAEQPTARVILMTGHGSAVGALEATSIGAYDYLVKPFTVGEFQNLAAAVREQLQPSEPNADADHVADTLVYASNSGLIGRSPAFVECLKMVGRVAATNLPVLMTGESGTGKELVARAIHERSQRAGGAFVAVNCGAIPADLIESELFGHVKGAFTGAVRDRIGLWQEADGGTILLDEITETSLFFQVKLLRAVQQNEIRRVGSNENIKVNVRVIAATNRNIEEEVEQNRFRQDLMYRLNTATISLPPLRERVSDIPLLAKFFAAAIEMPNAASLTFSAEALEMLKNYSWRGNIRELENAVQHAAALCDSVILPKHLPLRIRQFNHSETTISAPQTNSENSNFDFDQNQDEWLSLAAIEAKYVVRVLAHTNGNKQAAARLLNIDRKTLSRILARLNS